MSCVHYQNNELYIEQMSLRDIAAKFGTPSYVYSKSILENNWHAFDKAMHKLNHQICYAVKANSNLAILNLFARLGSGFDIVSGGELERVLLAGGDPNKIVFSGVGKTSEEISRALDVGIYGFNVESEQELNRIQVIAEQKSKVANISLRVNPNINPNTHPYIATGLYENKFGIELDQVLPLAAQISHVSSLKLTGITCHIGSQITEMPPFVEAAECLLNIYQQLKKLGLHMQHLDIGGGLGIRYREEEPPTMVEYAEILTERLRHYPIKFLFEPGRVLVADAGVLLTKVEYIKQTAHKNFAIVDAGMNDLLRPALYGAWQEIQPVQKYAGTEMDYDVVGPVCESADFLGKNRKLVISAGDLLVVEQAGAYGFCMSSNYNTRGRAAEILINGTEMTCIRSRETIQDLLRHEMD